MSIPTIFDWLEFFDFLRGYAATGVLLCTGILVVLFLDWRLALFALIIQYLVASLLFFDLLNPQLAFIKLFTGMFVCLILYWTARQVRYAQLHGRQGSEGGAQPGNPVRIGGLSIPRNLAERITAVLAALLLVALLEWAFSFRLPGFPEDLPYINLASLLLLALGGAGLIAGRHPFPSAMGVLTFLTGFELYFAALNQSTRLLAVLAALNFAVALAASYLTQRRDAGLAATLGDD
jgi:hypothetical protein